MYIFFSLNRDERIYKRFKKRGVALIFNHSFKHIPKLYREGSQVDEKNLKNILTILGFEVRVFNDQRADAIKSTLEFGITFIS